MSRTKSDWNSGGSTIEAIEASFEQTDLQTCSWACVAGLYQLHGHLQPPLIIQHITGLHDRRDRLST